MKPLLTDKPLVSACLCGISCRYDGTSSCRDRFRNMLIDGGCIPFCPEILGGLTTPREPAIIVSGNGFSVLTGDAKVILKYTAIDVSSEFIKGAGLVLNLARTVLPSKIYLKEKSPSCGLNAGPAMPGVTAALLLNSGFDPEPVE